MRPKIASPGQEKPVIPAKQPVNRIRESVAREQQAIIVINGNESSIKHPMESSRQRQTVSDTVRTSVFDRADMSSLHFRTASPINELDSGHSAGIAICVLHGDSKGSVPEWSGNQTFYDASILFERTIIFEGSRHLGKTGDRLQRLFWKVWKCARAMFAPDYMAKSSLPDQVELGVW